MKTVRVMVVFMRVDLKKTPCIRKIILVLVVWLKFGTQNFMYYGLMVVEKNPSCACNANCF